MECGSQKGYEDDEMMEVGSADEAEGSSDGSDVENELDEELDDEEDEEDIDELQDLLEEEEIHGLSHRRSTDEPSSSKGLQQAPSSNSGLSDEIAVRNESDTTALFHSTHPGVTIRRGPGRPRKGHMTVSPLQKNPSLKWSCSGLQAPKSNGSRGPYGPRKKRDYLEGVSSSHDLSGVSPSPPHELLSQYSSMDDMDNEQSNQIVDKCATSEDLLPVIPDKWPGKVCAICALGEKSTLGQGELLQVAISSTFDVENAKIKSQLDDSDPSSNGDKCLVTTPTTPAISQRRQMKFNRNLSVSGSECLDELSMVGFVDEPALVNIFEVSGFFYIHEACARWCPGVTVDNNGRVRGAENAILEALGKKCAHCSHLGASLACKADGCSKYFHLPCAAASGCFQDLSRTVTVCSMHLHLVRPNFAGDVVCAMCNDLGNIHNLIMCSRCGKHLHGACYGVGSSGSVRAGWQCSTCRQCQACRVPSERSKLLICDHCDKAYHQQCLRPLVSQVPKFGWKCKSCRICTDCGSRTPGAGQSSRWHNHFTVCDSCYQQRNKGQACPVCRRAYRHTAIKEMVQCTSCRKYVHGACDSDAELATYQAKKAAAPDYAYVCTVCKQYATRPAPVFKRCSIDDVDFSQDSYLYADDSLSGMDIDTVEKEGGDEVPRNLTGFGLGRGKPLAAVKMMKRRMPFGNMSYGNRPKGKLGLKKAKGMVDFPRKRGPKGKMQGVFGVPGVGLSKPTGDSGRDSKNSDDEPGGENRLVLCSAKDKFVLNQDVCVMCGALGLDQEGCLISCAQCGQCYHPYCVSIKVSKVILTKGWRCLDCTVCEGCGQRHDESRLILCDDCDISYHIYCMNPPLDFVPRGNWKCKWCAMCQLCGSSDPGFNCTWMNSFSHCGPCASLQVCPVCNEEYAEGQMIIKCFQCARWLHGTCDQIKTDEDAEKCSADGYNCVLCRPRDVPPPHLIPVPVAPKPPTPCKSPVHSGLKKLDAKGRANNSKKVPKVNPNASYFLDGVCLSEHGNVQIKTLTLEQPKKKRANAKGGAGKGGDAEAGILATIESVVSGGKLDGMMPGNQITPRDGAPVQLLPDGRPPEAPEGFQICTSDNGVQVWRRKRTRNLNKLGIGGFSVRTRILKPKDEDVFAESLSGNGFSPSMEPNLSHATSVYSVSSALLTPTTPTGEEKPKRKPNRKKPKNKLMENFPIYLQDAFFGRDLLDVSKEQTLKEVGESDDEKAAPATLASGIQLSQEELKEMENIKARKINEMTLAAHAKQQSEQSRVTVAVPSTANTSSNKGAKASEEEADADDEEALKDILPMNLLEGEDLVDMDNLMGDDDDLTKTNLDEMGETNGAGSETAENKDELTDILSPHFNLESMVRDSGLPNMDCKDVEEIFKGVLTDESQESQESSTFRISNMSMGQTQSQHSMVSPSQPAPPTPTMPTTSPMPRAQPISMGQQQNLASPMGFPPASPYHSEYSNSPQFSPAFSEPPSPWCQAPTPDQPGHEGSASLQDAPTSYNQRSSLKMEQDELLGSGSTMASVLYSNINHPEWKTEYPIWAERCKQIVKKWRTLSTESRAPYLQNARENRATQRMKKSQQMPSASSPAVKQEAAAGRAPSAAAGAAAASAATVVPSVTPPLLKKPSMTSTTSMTTASTALMKSATILTPPPQTTTPTSSTNADLEVCSSSAASPVTPLPSSPFPNTQSSNSSTNTPSPSSSPLSNASVDQQQQRSATVSNTVVDQHIRVLTPSEIMRTLPSLGQESYDPPLTPQPPTIQSQSQPNNLDQDKIIAQQKNTREAQEERKWKQQQAMRQQQQQMQQMIHEQRVQGNGMGIPRMHRPMDNQGILNLPPPSPVFLPDGSQTAAPVTSQLHVATGQDPSTSPMASPSPGSRPQFTQPLKVGMTRAMAPPSPGGPFAPPPSPRSMQTSPRADHFNRMNFSQGQDVFSPPQTSSQPQQQEDFNNQDFQQSGADPYAQPPLTPRPQPQKQPTTPTQAQPTFQAPRPVDPYAQPPGTPRPQPQQTFIPPAAPLPQQRQAFVTPRPVGPLDPYSQPPGTPRPVDPYAQPPGTPRPGTDDQSGFQMNQTNPEMTRQLRDLLQRNQFKKLEDEQLVPGQNNRIWPQEQRVEVQQQQQPQQQQQLQQFDNQGQQSSQEQEVANRAVSDNTFRHPLPPGMRPRVPGPQQMLVRGPQGQIIRQAMPNMDPRMRLLLQQHQQTQRLINQNPGANMQQQQQMFNQQSPQQPNQPQFVANMAVQPRMQGPRVPMEHMVQQRPQLPFPKQESNTHIMHQQQQQQRPLLRQMSNVESVVPNAIVPGMQPGQRLIRTMSGPPVMTEQPNMNQQQRMPTPSMQMEQQLPGIVAASAPVSATPQAAPVASAEVPSQEIPPHLAEEIEKLEQEGVSSLLELGDDDDELLGLGADFNILLYADPDLDAAPGGVKTNILDFEQEENEDKKDGPSRNTAQSQERTADATQPAMQPQANVTPQVPQQAVIQPQVPPNVTMRPQMQAKPFQQTFQGQQNPQGMMRPQMQGVQQRMVHPQQTMSGKPRLMQPMGPASQMLQSVGQARMMAGKPGVVPPNASLVPPPPYPGPPPPYPGATQLAVGGPQLATNHLHQQHMAAGLHPLGPHIRNPLAPTNLNQIPLQQRPSLQQQSLHMQQQQQRRPLLLQEQPLLLEDLLEQEKREQERQQAAQALQDPNAAQSDANSQSLHVSDMDFERLKADVMRSPNSGGSPGLSPPNIPVQGVGVMQPGQVPLRPPFTPAIRQSMQPQQQQWNPTMQQSQQMPQQIPQQMVNVQRPVVPMNQPQPVPLPQPQLEQVPRVQQIPPPPTPPDNIVTEQDRQAVVAYEKWLHGQHAAISNQLQNLEMQVSKYRKAKKSLSSKQRQLRKQQMELPPNDLSELARIGKEQQVIQKQLEQSRKLNKQHGMIIQDYKTKMQKRQPPNMMSNSPSPSSIGVHLSPLGPPTHNIPASASPALSTSPAISAMQQQSPLHSPVPHSPGPNVLAQSPGNVAQMSPRSLQPSPRLGTPHSQGDENQFSPSPSAPMQSPQTPVQRLTSPQGQMRMASPQQTMGQPMARPMQGQFPQPNQQYSEQMRNMMGQKFIRPDMQQGMSPSGVQMGQQPRPRMVAMQNMQNQMYMQQQQQQQQMQNQQMQSQQMQNQNFQQVPMQQAQQQQQQRMAAYQQSIGSPQQQQQQQQQRTVQFPASPMGSPQTQNQQSQQMRIQGGMPFPASPLGSPQQMRVNPNMPYPQSPLGSPQQMRVMHSPLGSPQPNMMIQPNASPMRRPSGSSGPSPLPPERPLSTENPLTPRTPGAQYHDMSQDGSGGGGGGNMMPAVSGGGGFNHHLIPIPPELRHIRYCKLGLVGGAPMWMENGGGGLGAGKPPSSSSQQSNNPAAGSSNQTESADSDIEAAVLSNMKDITVVVVGSSPASSVDDVEQSLASLVENIGDPHVEEEALIRKTEDAVDENKIVETLDELENEVDMKDEEDLLKTVDEHVEKTTSMERPSFVAHSATDTPASPDPENLGSPDPELMAEAECHLDETMNNEEKPAPVEVEPAPQPPPPSPPKAEQQKIEPPPPLQYPTVTRMPQISFETPNESSHVEEALKSVECEIKVEKEAQKEAESVKVAETPSLLQQLVEKKEEDTVDRSLPEPLRKMGELRQNVLLKQLLQNSACSTSQSSGSVSVPSLEAQLARPVPPTHSRLIPPLLNETPQNRPQMLRLPGVQQQPTSIIRPHQLIMNKDLMPHIPSQPLAAPQRPMLVQQNQQLNQQLQQRSSPGPASQASQPLSQPLQQQQQHQPQVPHQQPQQAQPIQQQQPQQQLPQQQLPQQQYQPQQQPQSQQHQMQPQQHQMQPQQHQMQPQQQQLLQHQPKLQIPTPPPQPARTPPQVSRTPPQVRPAQSPVHTVHPPTPPVVNQQPPTPQQQHLQQTQAIQQILQAQIKKEAAEQQQMLQASTTPPQPAATPPVQSAQEASSLQQQAPNLLRHIQQVGAPPRASTPTQPAQSQPAQQEQPLMNHHQQVVAPVEIKKEVEEQSVTPQSSRENTMDIDQNSCDNIIQPTETSAADLKKLKRRQYQQKRRQSAGKEGGPTPKKRSRKLSSTSQGSSKIEEDYDSYIDHLMPQVRQLPSLNVLEPELGRNYAVCPVFGAGDLAKLVPHAHNGTLIGRFGKANIPSVSDFYNTKPFGDLPQIQPDTPTSSQNGFYDQEFAPLKLESDEANRDREDSPDTVVSTSSPEFFMLDSHYRFPGLRLIKEDDSDTEEKEALRRASPVIPLLTPTPIRVRPGITFKDLLDLDKENMGGASGLVMRSRWGSSPTVPLRETGNITVTLTLSATAARDVEGALSGLARLLRLPTPLQFSVADTTTQPDYKLGVYRIRGLDGKEGAAINVQSILNDARFCRQCKCWAKNYISKRASDLPQNILSINELGADDDLYFCSDNCYLHFSGKSVGQTTMEKGIASKQINHSSLLKKSEKKAAEAKKNGTVKEEPMEVDPPPGPPPPPPSLKGIRFKTWSPGLQPPNKYKKPTDRELTDMLFRSGITLMPQKLPDDSRQCLFCHQMGDGPADGSGRLLNYDVDKWVHLNCALWSSDVYETENGALMNVEQALQQGLSQNCSVCGKHGATVKCFKTRCGSTYHLGCAVKDDCVFYKNKTAYCSAHIPKNEKESELTTLAVFRRVYVNRDENRQVAAVMHHSDQSHLLRVGSLIFLNVGQLLPHQLLNFHTQNYIYPIGYKIARIYWSMRSFNKRCRYICSIHDNAGRPEFRVLVQEANHPDLELKGTSARQVWMQIMEPMAAVRRGSGGVQVFPKFISGEDLFGLTEPAIIRVLESLPGIETLTDYKFKYGRNPLLELPLAVNPTGCARSEPKLRTHFKRPHTQRTGSVSIRPALVPAATPIGEATCPYSKQFVHSKSSQYKKMKLEWRNNVYLARSKIQGLGLYAARDLERHTMVIEYIGEIIRTELAEAREKQYEERNRGIYMFRLDEERVIDATLSGGLARYINHSCNPNCVAETVEVDRDFRIIIFAKRRINRGEELAYDYKFDIEDDQHKIPCLCGAPNCKKWMN